MRAPVHSWTARRRARRFAVTLAVALSLAASTSAWGSLCIGEDGHVALELVAGGICIGDAPAPSRPAPVPGSLDAADRAGGSPCCGPCIDLDDPGASLASTAPFDGGPEEALSEPSSWRRLRPAPSRRPSRPIAVPDATRERAHRSIATIVIIR